jgi:putative hydrolase
MDPLDALNEIAYLLERERSIAYKSKAFRNAAAILTDLDPAILNDPVRLKATKGVGDTTYKVITQALEGRVPDYLLDLRGREEIKADTGLKLRGDLHAHTSWSDGTTSIELMAQTARELGREYLAITDHSPRLRVANGLSPERLRDQLREVAVHDSDELRLLSGIEVDILDDGALDQVPELLERLDVVVASVHSKLKMDPGQMTRRMIGAVSNPHVNILGHITGRLVEGNRGTRPGATFDAEKVVAACAEHNTALELNSRPERQDPPDRIIKLAIEAGCLFSIDSDAHAPGQLGLLDWGAERAVANGIPPERIVTTWPVEKVLEWTRG